MSVERYSVLVLQRRHPDGLPGPGFFRKTVSWLSLCSNTRVGGGMSLEEAERIAEELTVDKYVPASGKLMSCKGYVVKE